MREHAATDLAEFYAAAYPRLVTALTVAARDRAEAEDAAQEAFTRLLRKRSSSPVAAPEAWLYTVGLNVLRTRWRRRARARERSHLITASPDPEEGTQLSADSLDLRQALRDLPRRYRDPLVMFYLLDLPIGQIADEAGVSVGTVKSQLSRGRTMLAGRLAEVTNP